MPIEQLSHTSFPSLQTWCLGVLLSCFFANLCANRTCASQIDAASSQRGVLPHGLGNGESWLLRKSMRSVGHRVKELTTSLANADDAMGKRGRRAEMLHDMPGAPHQPPQVATPVSSPTCVSPQGLCNGHPGHIKGMPSLTDMSMATTLGKLQATSQSWLRCHRKIA